MSDSDPAAGDCNKTRVCWQLSTPDNPRRCYASSPDSSAQALDMVLLGFVERTHTDSWKDVDMFAAIARDYGTFTPREIAGFLGIDLFRVVSASAPSDPPWTLSNSDGEITLKTWKESS